MPFFSLYLNICGLRTGPGKFYIGFWKVLDFLSVKQWEPCIVTLVCPSTALYWWNIFPTTIMFSLCCGECCKVLMLHIHVCNMLLAYRVCKLLVLFMILVRCVWNMTFCCRTKDFYHTCYCLSGLSVAQHFAVGRQSCTQVIGNKQLNEVVGTLVVACKLSLL